jgi:hypothetical protein
LTCVQASRTIPQLFTGHGEGRSIKRIAPIAVIVASLLALAGITPAGALGGLFTPGQLVGSGTFGFAQGFDESTSTFVLIQMQTGIQTFRPHRPGSPPITMVGNVVNISFDTLSDHGYGCWLFPSDELVVGSDLSATLNFDSSDPRVTECPGDPIGTSVLGAPPTLGPSGNVIGLVEPLRLSVTWTPAGPVTTTRSTTRYSCKPFMSVDEGSSQIVDSTTAGSASGSFIESGPFAMQLSGGIGTFEASSGTINITGAASAGCGAF